MALTTPRTGLPSLFLAEGTYVFALWQRGVEDPDTHGEWWIQCSGAGGKNPWSKEHWSLTEQGRVINSEGAEAAERLAKMAGSYVGATAPKA